MLKNHECGKADLQNVPQGLRSLSWGEQLAILRNCGLKMNQNLLKTQRVLSRCGRVWALHVYERIWNMYCLTWTQVEVIKYPAKPKFVPNAI